MATSTRADVPTVTLPADTRSAAIRRARLALFDIDTPAGARLVTALLDVLKSLPQRQPSDPPRH